MITSLLIALLALHSGSSFSESDSLIFKPPELSRVSLELAGSESNWPIVFQVAEYRSGENTFVLDADSRAKISHFHENWRKFEAGRDHYSKLIKNGAGVFAAREVARSDSLLQAFRWKVDRGDIDGSIRIISEYRRSLEDVSNALDQNRIVDVEARLSEKQGTVELRRGLIGQWLGAAIGSLFREADGVRTNSESTGKIAFVDGSEVSLSSNTTAIIRSSRLDRLTNTSDVEINISQGGLLARLSADGIQRSNYEISAGTATMLVRSSNFWAEKTDDDRVIMANYSGFTTVTAENEVISLGRNEGTIVERGRSPSQPVPLLPAPRLRWAAADSVIIRDRMTLAWAGVDGAVRYEVDISDSPSFDGWVRSIQTLDNSASLSDIPTGISHLRIRAFDQNDLRGTESQTYRILRSTGTLPPYLFLVDGDPTEIYTSEPEITITGVTEPGSTLLVNGSTIPVSDAGDFQLTQRLEPGRNTLRMMSANPAGTVTRQDRFVTRFSEEKLFDINWSSFAENGRIAFADDLLLSGRAYPPLEVVARLGDEEKVVPCGVNGDWAMSVNPEPDSELTIALRFRHNKKIIAERTFRIE